MTNFLIKHFIPNASDVKSPAVRQRYGVVSGVVGILCNALLCTAKIAAGLLTGAVSIVADGINNLSDGGSCVVSLLGFKMAGKPADDKHPFGHGRIEYVAGLIVSFIIVLMGVELAKTSLDKIFHPEEISFSWITPAVLGISILVKLWMCFFNRKMGDKIDSAVLRATAMDSLSDVAATSAVLAGFVIGYWARVNLDGYLGVLVALFILYTGVSTAKGTLDLLLGEAPDPEFVKQIQQEVLSYPEIIGVHDLIVHNYGPGHSVVSLHAEVPCDVDILKIHDTIDNAERDLKKKFDCEVVIHMDPIITDDKETNEIHQKLSSIVRLLDSRVTIHDFRMVKGPTHTNLIFDIVVPHQFRLTDDRVVESLRQAVKALDARYEIVVNVDKAYTAPPGGEA
ncbi:MAG: cation diffusion facilitator family transporter [[Clostridium] leptum]